jgi:hypothetical protein
MNIRKLLVATMLSLGACTAFAQSPGADQGSGQGRGPRPSAEEREKRCQANPEKCAEIKQKIEKRREEFKKKCDADPKACAEKKAQIREKMEERRERRQASRGAMKERGEGTQSAPRQPAR